MCVLLCVLLSVCDTMRFAKCVRCMMCAGDVRSCGAHSKLIPFAQSDYLQAIFSAQLRRRAMHIRDEGSLSHP